MSLPPCHPQFPGLPTLRRRHGPQYELSRGHRASGLQLNLTWLMNLLEKIPGPHQQRIPSQSRQQTLQAAVTTDGLPHDGVQQGDFRPPHDQHQCCNRCHCCVPPTFHKSASCSLRPHISHRMCMCMSMAGGGISKEELGRGTWTFLHTLAAQWPQQPTRQQQKDLTSLVRR